MNAKQLMKRAIAIGIVGTIAFCETVPAIAAPVPSSTVIVKTAAPNMLEQVRVRRGRRGPFGPGFAFGVIGTIAAIAAQSQYYQADPGYYVGPGYYAGPGYYVEPGYAGPGYYVEPGYVPYAAPVVVVPSGRCWITTDRDRNFGYWGRC